MGEAAVRWFDVGPRFAPVDKSNYRICENPDLRYELVPGSDYLGDPINADGLRDRERPIAKPPGVFRIACIGDSITFGLYVPSSETFAARLEARLNADPPSKGTTYEVLNFGVTGYNISQSAANLSLRAMKYSPDLVVHAYCLNDPSQYSREFAVLRNRAGAAKRRYLDEILHEPRTWAGHSRLYRLAHYAWMVEADAWGRGRSSTSAYAVPAPTAWTDAAYFRALHADEEGTRRVENGFRRIADIVAPARVPVLVAVFPLMDAWEGDTLSDVREQIRASAAREKFAVLDLLPAYQSAAASSPEPLAVDNLHPSPRGHAVAAEAMHEAIKTHWTGATILPALSVPHR